MLVAGGQPLPLHGRAGRRPDAARASCSSSWAITIVQERRTERALDALRDLSSPRALVIRDGAHRRIAGREVVRGDIIMLVRGRPRAGRRRPAARHQPVGRRVAADRRVGAGAQGAVGDGATSLDRPGGDDLPSRLLRHPGHRRPGHRRGRCARARAPSSARSARRCSRSSPSRRCCRRRPGAWSAPSPSSGSAPAPWWWWPTPSRAAAARAAWKEGLLAGIAMAMATLPEEFPVVLTVFLALGAWRISRSRVLTRRMPAVETLGAATVLCVDKTGTLTQNQMTLRSLAVAGPRRRPGRRSRRRCPRTSTRCSSTPSWPASATRSTRWSGPCTRPGDRLLEADRAPASRAGRWCASTRCTPELLAVCHAWQSPERRRGRRRAPRARRRPSPTCAT